jgi:hypothetical protein
VSGLPSNARDGEIYDITVALRSQGQICVSVVAFLVSGSDADTIHVTSTNTEPLDLAPVGHPALVLAPATQGRVRRSRLGPGSAAPHVVPSPGPPDAGSPGPMDATLPGGVPEPEAVVTP